MSVKICPTCGAAQPVEHARFCLECGAPLAASSLPYQASLPANGGASLPVGGASQPNGAEVAPDALAAMAALPVPEALPVAPALGTPEAATPIMPVAGMAPAEAPPGAITPDSGSLPLASADAASSIPAGSQPILTDTEPLAERAEAETADDAGDEDSSGDTSSLGYVIVQMDAPVHLIDEAATMSQPPVVYMDAPVHLVDEAATLPPISQPTGSFPNVSSPGSSAPRISAPARSFPPSMPRVAGPNTGPMMSYPPATSAPGYVSAPIPGSSTPSAAPKLLPDTAQQLTSVARGVSFRAIIFMIAMISLPIALVAISNAQSSIDSLVRTPLLQIFDALSLYLILPVAALSLVSSFWYTLLRLAQPPTVTKLWGETFLACVVTLLGPALLFGYSLRLDSLMGFHSFTPLGASPPVSLSSIQSAAQVEPYALGILTLIIAVGTAVGTGVGKNAWERMQARMQRPTLPGNIWNDRLIAFGSAAGVLMVLTGLEKMIINGFDRASVHIPFQAGALGITGLRYYIVLLALPVICAIALPIIARFMMAQRLRQ
jgi:hypothetical protein